MAEYIAVEGCEFEIPEDTAGLGQVTLITQPQEYLKVCNKKPYAGPLQFTLSGITTSAITNGDGMTTAPAVLSPGAQYTKLNGLYAVLEGDEIQNVPITGHSGESTVPDTVTVRIKKAGQEYVKVT